MMSDRPASSVTGVPVVAIDTVGISDLYQVMVENTLDVIIRYNAAREPIFVSPACREMLGFEPAEYRSLPIGHSVHPEEFVQFHTAFSALGRDKPSLNITFRLRRRDGVYIWVEAGYRHVPEDGTVMAVLRDISARKNAEVLLTEANDCLEAANDLLRGLVDQDDLTGLANRRWFEVLLEQEFRRAARQRTPVAVVLLDVDSFKGFNGLYGHLAGDDCLRRISRTIGAALQRPGDCGARFSGQAFVVLLPATDLTGAMKVAGRILAALFAMAIEHLGSSHRVVTVSAGASAVIPYEDDTAAHLVAAAERALGRCKFDGGNCAHGSEAGSFRAAF